MRVNKRNYIAYLKLIVSRYRCVGGQTDGYGSIDTKIDLSKLEQAIDFSEIISR